MKALEDQIFETVIIGEFNIIQTTDSSNMYSEEESGINLTILQRYYTAVKVRLRGLE